MFYPVDRQKVPGRGLFKRLPLRHPAVVSGKKEKVETEREERGERNLFNRVTSSLKVCT